MEKLIEGLRYFRSNLLWQKRELFAEAVWGQRPFAMLITCSDSRLLPETLLQLAPGDLFVSRNAGNLVPSPEVPGGEAAAIEYAVSVLGVTDLIVCGHYRCGAVAALLQPADESLPAVCEWLQHASETRQIMERDHSMLTGDEKWDKAVEQNVLVQVRHLAAHPCVAAGLKTGAVRILAWAVRFETGQIFSECPEHERFVPLLELEAVRGTHPGNREVGQESTVTRRRKNGWSRWQTGSLAASVLALLTLTCAEGLRDRRASRINGAPPESVRLADSHNSVASCLGRCIGSAGDVESPYVDRWTPSMREWK